MKKTLCKISTVLLSVCLTFAMPAFAESVDEVNVANIGFMLDKADGYAESLTKVSFDQEEAVDIDLMKIDKAIAQAAAETDLKLFGYRQINSNKLSYKESNVFTVSFAKEQNQNFERMRSAS